MSTFSPDTNNRKHVLRSRLPHRFMLYIGPTQAASYGSALRVHGEDTTARQRTQARKQGGEDPDSLNPFSAHGVKGK